MNKAIDMTYVTIVNSKYKWQKWKKESHILIISSISILLMMIASIVIGFLLFTRVSYNCEKYLAKPLKTFSEINYIYENKKPLAYYSKNNSVSVGQYVNDIYYMAQCVMAEAGNQDDFGKRLVIDVILNRARLYNKNTTNIINEPNQFACVTNRSIYEQLPSYRVYQLILEECVLEKNGDILYFKTDDYHDFGTPVIKYMKHYFSK